MSEKTPKKINGMYAFVTVDPNDPSGDEGIPAFSDPLTGLMMPMVGADLHRVYSLLPIARKLCPWGFRILMFTGVEDITQKIMDNG